VKRKNLSSQPSEQLPKHLSNQLSNLTLRIISAIIIALLGFSALVLNIYSRWGLITLILVLGAWEFSRMISKKLSGPSIAWLPAFLVFLFTLPFLPNFSLLTNMPTHIPLHTYQLTVTVITILILTLIGFRFVEISSMAPWIYLQLFGCAYFGLYATALFSLVTPERGWSGIFPLLLVQLAIATADTGAYATGRAFGKHKLCPSISSGKTIEGAVGGAILTTFLVVLLGPKLLGTPIWINVGLGLVLSGTAIMGDLFISILKRYSGFKDSSQLIPGHGGILDRFDAMFFCAPFAMAYLEIFR